MIVELSVDPDDLAQLADDSDRVYAEIFKTLPGFLFGTLGVTSDGQGAVGVVYFESEEAFRAAEPVVEGVREAVAISPGATFTLREFEVVVRRAGLEPAKLLPPSDQAAAPGAPA